jgi:hypothetical protein
LTWAAAPAAASATDRDSAAASMDIRHFIGVSVQNSDCP